MKLVIDLPPEQIFSESSSYRKVAGRPTYL